MSPTALVTYFFLSPPSLPGGFAAAFARAFARAFACRCIPVLEPRKVKPRRRRRLIHVPASCMLDFLALNVLFVPQLQTRTLSTNNINCFQSISRMCSKRSKISL